MYLLANILQASSSRKESKKKYCGVKKKEDEEERQGELYVFASSSWKFLRLYLSIVGDNGLEKPPLLHDLQF